VLVATGSQHTYVPVADDCQRINRTDCGASRGVSIFGNRQSPGFQSNASSTWQLIGLYEIGVNEILGYSGNGITGYDSVGFRSTTTGDVKFLKQHIITAYATPDLWVGQLGLGVKELIFRQDEHVSSFLEHLKDAGIIPSLSFGYTAGASYRKHLIYCCSFTHVANYRSRLH
jgi:hypothetical protein